MRFHPALLCGQEQQQIAEGKGDRLAQRHELDVVAKGVCDDSSGKSVSDGRDQENSKETSEHADGTGTPTVPFPAAGPKPARISESNPPKGDFNDSAATTETAASGAEEAANKVPAKPAGLKALTKMKKGLWSSLRGRISKIPLCGRGTVEESKAWAKQRFEAYHEGDREPAHDRLYELLQPKTVASLNENEAMQQAMPVQEIGRQAGDLPALSNKSTSRQAGDLPADEQPGPSGASEDKIGWAHQRLTEVKFALKGIIAKNNCLVRDIGLMRLRLTVAHIMMAEVEEHFVGTDRVLAQPRSDEAELERQMESGWMTYREKQAGEELVHNRRQVRVASGQLHGLQHTLRRVIEEQEHLMREVGLMWLLEAWLEARWWKYHDMFAKQDAVEQRRSDRVAAMKKIEDGISAVAAEDVEARKERRQRLGLGEFAVEAGD